MQSHRLSSRRSNVWRGDLVRSHWFESAYSLQRDEVLPLITRLGFDALELSLEDPALNEIIDNAKSHAAAGRRQSGQEQPVETNIPEVIDGWVTTKFQSPPWPEADQGKPDDDPISNEIGPPKPVVEPKFRPLASWSQLRTRLQPLLNRPVVTGRVDEKKLVRRLCRCESISKLPRVIRKKSPEHLHVIADRSERCIPYFADQALVSSQLALELAQDKCSYFVGEFPQSLSKSDDSLYLLDRRLEDKPLDPVSGSSVLILGDLGLLERKYPSEIQSWIRACRTWKQQGVSIYALLPYSVEQLPREIRQLVEPIAWQGNRIDYVMDELRQSLVERIFTACYPAMRLEPGLLREIRSMIPDASDASLESDIWQHHYLQSNHRDGARNDRADIKALLGSGFEQLDKETRRRILEVQRQYRMASGFRTFWQLEFSNLSDKTQRLLKEYRADHEAMVRTVREYARVVKSRYIPDEMNDQIVWYAKRVSEEALANKQVGKSVRMLRNVYQRERPAHKKCRLRELATDGRSRNAIFDTTGRSLILENVLVGSATAGSFDGEHIGVGSTSRIVEVHVPRAELPKEKEVSPERAFWKSGKKPDWVSDFGTDEYGAWCEFQVPRHDGNRAVTQRMRWIKPGKFMMGSPEDEAGRGEYESPHEVTLTQGFWLADTPCTQALWMAIAMGQNPSDFWGEQNPVENVSWRECQEWLTQLKTFHASMHPSLPSEAQREYACRAGSTGSYCFGDSEGELDKYAWYDRKGGITTHQVGGKLCNSWGLYDIHGNVWEWCQDRFGKYPFSSVIDPVGPEIGTLRVARGGGWLDPARLLRSACRGRNDPDDRLINLGFRIASSALGAEPNERASSVQAIVKPTEPGRDPTEARFWKSGKKPDWVSAFGRDEYGLWCEFQLPNYWPDTEAKSADRTGTESQGFVTQRMRWINPGTFMMGSPETTSDLWIGDETKHEVTLTQGFWIATTPCTQELWLSVVRKWNPEKFSRRLHPVDGISWEDCQAWIKKLKQYVPLMNPGLPSEAQWEYACRAGASGEYCFGDSEDELGDYAWYGSNSGNGAHSVGQKLPNAWGVYDMHGNIWEWCHDWYGKFSSESMIDPVGLEKGQLRVTRGGGWNSPARDLRSSCRFRGAPNDRLNFLGFRLSISAQGAEPSVEASSVQAIVKPTEPVGDPRERAFWKSGKKPDWVSAFGKDDYGLWYEFQLPNRWPDTQAKSKDRTGPESKSFVTQRMRWIKPGTFTMGSDASTKVLWWGDETQHEVTLKRGFWMADTPCKQGLWMEVGARENRSEFQGFSNPVERVSWEDCQAWLKGLGDVYPQLQPSLPTEAQWEYACRAGSTSAYCFGDEEQELEKYAWYEKNSNEKTHPVGEKLPNAWGLYDVHGNVWEWCQDWYENFTKASVTDPVGPAVGTYRVIRGGCWNSPARHLRSACRFRFVPGVRNYILGFRLLSSALVAEPSERAMLPEAEPGTERARIGSSDVEYGFLQSIDLDASGETTPEDEFSEIEVNAYTSIRVVSDQEGYQFDRLEKPDWTVDFGSDAYGLYSVFEVEPEKKGIPVRQKMRWIPPGRLFMGTAEGKDYGRGNEGPEHEVILTHGYWMFDTPCTQGLWTALMGKNPSYFQDPDRPVEQVSWEDAVGFAVKLNEWFAKRRSNSRSKKVLGWSELSFRLPTEAEWEYACRAGSQGDTYAGNLNLKTEDQTKAEMLDSIAWYGGNSGREYDLKIRREMSWLNGLEEQEMKGGTRKVTQKAPNPWGLYDMLGNVWEWCEDRYGKYLVERATDPIGPSEGMYRVSRGGSWDNRARYLRSACRYRNDPGKESSYLGFRLLSSAREIER